MKRDLYIVGAGGFGREVYAWLMDLPKDSRDWELRGFLDDNLSALDGFSYPIKVVSTVSAYAPKETDLFVCGIGAVGVKHSVCVPMIEVGAEFMTLVHPSAIVGPNVSLGDGVVICPRVTLTCDIEIGSMTMVNCHSTVGHDAKVGAWSTISAQCDLTGGVVVGESVFMGSRASIIPGKKVGSAATVGAGSVVIRSIPDGAKVFGNPAREFA